MQETRVLSLSREDPLKEKMATHSSILAWRSHGQRSLVGYSPKEHTYLGQKKVCGIVPQAPIYLHSDPALSNKFQWGFTWPPNGPWTTFWDSLLEGHQLFLINKSKNLSLVCIFLNLQQHPAVLTNLFHKLLLTPQHHILDFPWTLPPL